MKFNKRTGLKCLYFLISFIVFFAVLFTPTANSETTSINLSVGWNFISFPKLPVDKSITNVLADVSKNARIVWGFDNNTKEWLKWNPSISTLTTIESGKGYWIYMNNPAILSIDSQPSSMQAIPFYNGWNLIGFNGKDGSDIMAALSGISDKWEIVWSYENGLWKAKPNPSINYTTTQPLDNFYKGKAYWIKISSASGAFNYNVITHHMLTVTKSGTGNGIVSEDTLSNQNINCGELCSFNYEEDTVVTLTATPDANSSFNGWSGACTGFGICTVKMNNQKNVNADFQLKHSDISILPTSYNFGNVTVKTTSPSKEFKISNAGNANLDISSINLSGANSEEFIQANNCSTVGIGGSCTVTVNFKPTSAGAKNAKLTISSNDPDKNIINILLSGTGIESASGIWSGTFNSNVIYKSYNILGVITETGEGRFLSDEGMQFMGNVSVNGYALTSTVTAFAPLGYVFIDGSNYGTIKLNGTVKTRDSLSGTYSGVGDSGTFTLTYKAIYERGSSLSLLSGEWANNDPSGYSHNITVGPDGKFSGKNSYGCKFSGSVKILNSEYNAYRMENVRISSCGAFDGTYNGLGVLSDYSGTNDLFTLGMSNSYVSMVLSFIRQ